MISQQQTGDFICVLPSSDEQERIANVLESQDAVIKSKEANCEKLRTLKTGLMQDLRHSANPGFPWRSRSMVTRCLKYV